MKMPLFKTNSKKSEISDFSGLDTRENIDSTSLLKAYNIECDDLKTLKVRPSRKNLTDITSQDTVTAFFPKRNSVDEELLFTGIKNNTLYYKGNPVTVDPYMGIPITSGEKEIIDYDGKLIIMPDRLYFDYTKENATLKPLNLEISAPASVLMIDNLSGKGNILRLSKKGLRSTRYTAQEREAYIKKFEEISQNQNLAIEFFTETITIDVVPRVSKRLLEEIKKGKGACLVTTSEKDEDYDYIDVHVTYVDKDQNELIAFTSVQVNVRVIREFPEFSSFTAIKNRIFGVAGRRIFISARNSSFSFGMYLNQPTDSLVCDIKEDDEFVATSSYKNKALLFKKSGMYEFYDSKEGILSSNSYKVGCIDKRSIAVSNEGVYFLSQDGVYLYKGENPKKISDQISTKIVSGQGAIGGGAYYLLCVDDSSQKHLFVYNTEKKLWHEENADGIKYVASDCSEVFFCTENGNMIKYRDGTETVNWETVLNPFTEDRYDKKTPFALVVRAKLENGAQMTASIKTDNDSNYKTLDTIIGKGNLTSFYIPINSNYCDNFTIKLSGTGFAKIYGIEKRSYIGEA